MPRYGDTSIDMPYVQQQVIRGTVQLTLPTAGIILVRPASTGPMEPMLACRLDSVGGLVGATAYQTILPGQQVFIHRYVDDYHCSLVSVTDNGDQLIGVRSASLLYNYPWTVPVGKSQLDKKIKAQIDTLMYGRNSGFCSSNGCPPDIYAGDYVIGDKNGGHFFIGRAQMLLKGSNMAYIQLDSVNNKITNFYTQKQNISLYSHQKQTPNVSFKLRAIDTNEGCGVPDEVAIFQDRSPDQSDADVQKLADITPAYRQQEVTGGAYNGHYKSIMFPVYEGGKPLSADLNQLCLSSQVDHYSGIKQTCAQTIMSIKSPRLRSLQYSDKQIETLATQPQFIGKDFNAALLTAGTDAILLCDDYLQRASYPCINQKLMTYINQDNFFLSPSLYGYCTDKELFAPSDRLSDQQLFRPRQATLENKATGQTIKVFDTTSFITQTADGSILIKDGWGSQIRMTGGNIIISSALDTFIRPGRDLIELVPRLKQTTANGPLVLSAKQSIKIGAQTDVNIASALAGGIGKTVIQNLSYDKEKDASGITIRSNSDVTMTASRNMYLGINDRSQQRPQQEPINPQEGKFVIDGGSDLDIFSSSYIRCVSRTCQLYSTNNVYDTSVGSVLSLSPYTFSVGTQVTRLSSHVQVGGVYQNRLVTTKYGDIEIQAQEKASIIVSGAIDTNYLSVRGQIISTGAVIGNVFATTRDNPQRIIPAIDEQSRDLINQTYGQKIEPAETRCLITVWSQPSCYSDAYILAKEFAFNESEALCFEAPFTMPGVCWQQDNYYWQRQDFDATTLGPVVCIGKDARYTRSYPGSYNWQHGTLSVCVQGQLKTRSIQQYITNVDSPIKEFTND